MWIFDSNKNKFKEKHINYVPGLYKIFGIFTDVNHSVDEIIVNAADNYQRDKKTSMIKVTID